MFFIPSVVFTTEYIHKFIKDGPGLEVPSPEVFALHGGSVECAISGFRHARVCVFWFYANLFLSNLQEWCSIPILSPFLMRAQLFKPRLDFARMDPSKFSGNPFL
jgi:hypothetical protein